MFELFLDEVNAVLRVKVVVVFDDDKEEEEENQKLQLEIQMQKRKSRHEKLLEQDDQLKKMSEKKKQELGTEPRSSACVRGVRRG